MSILFWQFKFLILNQFTSSLLNNLCNHSILISFLIILIKIICILFSIAYFIIAKRKIMAAIQWRLAPNTKGDPFEILQLLADGLKLWIKELIIPEHIFIYFLATILFFILSLIEWSVILFYYKVIYSLYNIYETFFEKFKVANTNYGVLFLSTISYLNVYSIVLWNWASNSKYALLKTLRSAAQMISYKVSISLTTLPVILIVDPFNFFKIIYIQQTICWFFLPLLPCAVFFFLLMQTGTNRATFDLPEAEAKFVAGYNIEYFTTTFAQYLLIIKNTAILKITRFYTFLLYGDSLIILTNIHYFYINITPILGILKFYFILFTYILIHTKYTRYYQRQLIIMYLKLIRGINVIFFISCIFICILIIFNNSPSDNNILIIPFFTKLWNKCTTKIGKKWTTILLIIFLLLISMLLWYLFNVNVKTLLLKYAKIDFLTATSLLICVLATVLYFLQYEKQMEKKTIFIFFLIWIFLTFMFTIDIYLHKGYITDIKSMISLLAFICDMALLLAFYYFTYKK